MNIAIVQITSLRGNIQENIKNHLKYINHAIQFDADLIIFPELSITNFEPSLANEFATTINDIMFAPFQKLSNEYNITIGIGMPTKAPEGIQISMLIFQPNNFKKVYSKQVLHSDEMPYFVCGNQSVYITLHHTKIGIGICYESLQLDHFFNAKKEGSDIYIASVAKPKNKIKTAIEHFSKISNEFSTPILMVNSLGQCEGFISGGQSTVWNRKGEILEQLDANNEGLLLYDTKSASVKKINCL
ncbi:carbon-nitrogen hydrolase family protein [Aquimarina sp. U1-2]|uniref:carbon-nitrogen hydrolase family protein n=1 Tax=Aquimarina sp. U1-2 TaxID=2823141 RepID=UPI001AECA3D9|nr:carbon-nitrogen hydrolase family protein [Aquimarina sp. U1-2]MBP2831962.1 carbon-nitrogen hydrolase family protein [Aquimarina sp. U1-2]